MKFRELISLPATVLRIRAAARRWHNLARSSGRALPPSELRMLRALDKTGAMVAGQVMTGGRAAPTRRPRVVIVGAGFGGINAAIGLKSADVDVIVIDRRNYHLSSLCSTRLPPPDCRPRRSPCRSAIC
jgi:NADPH-dependent 2,4-dienoyl-CoA reductase/sulfur reductase-like enzyme